MHKIEEKNELLEIRHHAEGYRSVHMNGGATFITSSDEGLSAYLKGITDGLNASLKSRGKEQRMKINIDMAGEEIRECYQEVINEKHSYALFAFDSNFLIGSDFYDKLYGLLGQLIDNLGDCHTTHSMDLSFFIHPNIIDWEGSSGPALCIYIGCIDDECDDGSMYDELNSRLRKIESYVCAEGNSPEECPIFGFYDAGTETLYIASELALTVNHATGQTERR